MASRAWSAAAALPLAVTVAAMWPARAGASGFELVEQSPEATATAGAQAADASSAAAVYYNPAALAFQNGTTVQGGADILVYRGSATASAGAADSSALYATPTVFAGARIAARFAAGIGVFDPFAFSISYPPAWAGSAFGTALDLRALAVNPSVALRPLPWLALGFGVDVVPATLAYRRAGAALDLSGTGVGGNAGLFVRILPRWLDAAFTYRSAIDLDLSSSAAKGTLPLPHAFTFALATHPIAGLTLDADVRLTLWQDLGTVGFTFSDMTTPKETLTLDYNDTVGVRVGASWRFWRDGDGEPRLAVRVGGGWEQSPTNAAATSPLLPDGDRYFAGGGLGARLGFVSVDAGYLAAISSDFLGADGTFVARYHSITHTVSIALTFRVRDVPWHNDEPDFRR
ncbi:MAG TPA: outer membrane protein transport protein [Polyangia bacterium]